MRAIFSVVGLLLVLAVVGLMAKKQMGSVTGAPAASPQQQSQQVQQQVKQSVEAAMQQARPMPDDK